MKRGAWLWQDTRPHSLPSITMDTDMDASVPMLRMYSRCTGETLRNWACDRSMPEGASVRSSLRSGTGV